MNKTTKSFFDSPTLRHRGDGVAEELRRDLTIGPHPKVWTWGLRQIIEVLDFTYRRIMLSSTDEYPGNFNST